MQRRSPSITSRSVLVATFLFGLLLASAAWAQGDTAPGDAAIDACHNKESTADIVACLDGLTAQWDKRLNANYQTAIKRADPGAVAPLRASERAWLEFRKQRCNYVAAVPGTIASILGSDCFLRMTKARAEELAEDAKGLGE